MTRVAAAAAVSALVAAWATAPTSAHVTVVSPYTFNQHVLPILREWCGACHGGDGTGRQLTTFEQVRANQVEIERALLSGRMPPWSAAPGAAGFKGQQTLTPRELDTLMTWAVGGAPEGTTAPASAPARRPESSQFGAADLSLPMPVPFVLGAGQRSAVHEVVFAATAARGRAIRAVGIVPGDASIVRRAEVAIRTGGGDRTIALWVPGDTPQALEADAAYPVPRGASIVLRVLYARPPGPDTAVSADRTQVDLYFSSQKDAPAPRDLVIADGHPFPVDAPRIVSQRVARAARAVAVRPVSGPVDAIVDLEIVGAGGARRPLARLQLRPDWPRRYVFETPVSIDAASRIEARVSRRDPGVWATLTGDVGIPIKEEPLRIAIETVD